MAKVKKLSNELKDAVLKKLSDISNSNPDDALIIGQFCKNLKVEFDYKEVPTFIKYEESYKRNMGMYVSNEKVNALYDVLNEGYIKPLQKTISSAPPPINPLSGTGGLGHYPFDRKDKEPARDTAKPEIKEAAEVEAGKKKALSPSAKAKEKARQDPLYREIESVKKRMDNKLGSTLLYVLNKTLSYGYKNEFVEYKETNPKLIIITLPDNFLGDLIAAKAITSDNYNEETFHNELSEASKNHLVSLKNKDGKTIITITI